MSKPSSDEATLEIAHSFAASRGGICVSVEVETLHEKLQWRCGEGHEFEASLTLTRHSGYWCPQCAPHFDDISGWNYDEASDRDPLLAQFHTKLRY